jgi:hypothetical protein
MHSGQQATVKQDSNFLWNAPEKVNSQYICAMASLPDDMDTRIAKLRLELAEAEQEKKRPVGPPPPPSEPHPGKGVAVGPGTPLGRTEVGAIAEGGQGRWQCGHCSFQFRQFCSVLIRFDGAK